MSEQEDFDKLRHELRRGAIVLAVLAQLQGEHYGYSLRNTLRDRGIEIDEGTLYPLLRRLEKQGLLSSEWREDAKRRKRYYQISTAGSRVLLPLRDEWQKLNQGIQNILDRGDA